MKILFLILVSGLFLISCDGPRNHKVKKVSASGLGKSNEKMSFKSNKIQISVSWLSPLVGSIDKTNTLIVYLFNKQGALVDPPKDLTVEFYAIMPSMGHPMGDAGFFEKLDTGIYINKNIVFNMDGDWLMEVLLLNKDYVVQDKVEWEESW